MGSEMCIRDSLQHVPAGRRPPTLAHPASPDSGGSRQRPADGAGHAPSSVPLLAEDTTPRTATPTRQPHQRALTQDCLKRGLLVQALVVWVSLASAARPPRARALVS